ncbi:phage tail protein [Labrenzia sp. R4_2]|uniref:phage tail protein n=1 Tax=Labrenzia sp. R4_2 TaxID=2821107 RepID=UPI001ADC4A6A|nr:phage tail protein [Labrenzia sp. R4_2]MBO9421703.1 phage tail protein [Labrenzia sp. R4_2]
MAAFAYLGDLQLGVSSVMTGPTGASETLENSFHEHKVLRGKPIPQEAGEKLDKRSFSFFFDESFCDPEAEYAKLKAMRSKRQAVPLIFGNGSYDGKKFWPKSVKITLQKTTESGRIVRLEASIELIEVPGGALSIGGSGAASLARAIINPLTKRLLP